MKRRRYGAMHDRWGHRNSESFYDTKGDLCDAVTSGYGYARLEQKNNKFGDIEEIRLFDKLGNPCVRTGFGYSMIRFTYSGRQLTKQCYYDENGKLFDFDYRNPRATTCFFMMIAEIVFQNNTTIRKATHLGRLQVTMKFEEHTMQRII